MNQGVGIKRQKNIIHCHTCTCRQKLSVTCKRNGGVFCLFSSIRTVTVGSGVSPDLLTFAPKKSCKALAGFPGIRSKFPGYRRWGISPRPENVEDTTPVSGSCQSPIPCKNGSSIIHKSLEAIVCLLNVLCV